MKPTYRIRDWSKHFENNRTRELKELRFVILPNKHDGDGYTELLDHANGAAHYGAWCAIVQVASKGQHPAEGCDIPAGCCECRGVLLRDGARPHDPDTLSRLTRIPASIFAEVLPRLVVIGWLESSQAETQQEQVIKGIPHPPAELSTAESRTPLRKSAASIEQNGMEENGIEQKKDKRADKPHDPRSKHPAIVAVQNVRGSYPPKAIWDTVIELLGDHPDVPRLGKLWVAWVARGYKPMNYGWLVDWYPNGIEGERNGTTQQRNGYETAAEKRGKQFSRHLAIVEELRRESSGDHHDVESGQPRTVER